MKIKLISGKQEENYSLNITYNVHRTTTYNKKYEVFLNDKSSKKVKNLPKNML